MFESIINYFKKFAKKNEKTSANSKEAAKERLHLVLMQDRANVSADFLELMKQEIIEVIKKYIEVDEREIDVRLTNKENADGTNGAPALYANIPILNIKNEVRKTTGEAQETNQEIEKENESKSKEELKEETKKEDEQDKKNNIDNLKEEERELNTKEKLESENKIEKE